MTAIAKLSSFSLTADHHRVNDRYLEILGESSEERWNSQTEDFWLKVVHDDDYDRFVQQWERLKQQKVPITIDYRLKTPFKSVDQSTGQEITGDRWLLATAFPEVEADGKVSSVQGWIEDISHRKFSENLLAQRLEDALENKRQSENFIGERLRLDLEDRSIGNELMCCAQT